MILKWITISNTHSAPRKLLSPTNRFYTSRHFKKQSQSIKSHSFISFWASATYWLHTAYASRKHFWHCGSSFPKLFNINFAIWILKLISFNAQVASSFSSQLRSPTYLNLDLYENLFEISKRFLKFLRRQDINACLFVSNFLLE